MLKRSAFLVTISSLVKLLDEINFLNSTGPVSSIQSSTLIVERLKSTSMSPSLVLKSSRLNLSATKSTISFDSIVSPFLHCDNSNWTLSTTKANSNICWFFNSSAALFCANETSSPLAAVAVVVVVVVAVDVVVAESWNSSLASENSSILKADWSVCVLPKLKANGVAGSVECSVLAASEPMSKSGIHLSMSCIMILYW
ncbi:hypothetical protein WICPIJ_003595 [Wickerhamomyces pijperi]|uniref:Uncharacterized protein n=1 Tax=Wickerhamomyces pijperi TaxID=599730 RepID=A0A9P8Q9D1_WICPI|nr:hypothetical protein WICPIJ_003595 [Wickerhamomyces pijperi]